MRSALPKGYRVSEANEAHEQHFVSLPKKTIPLKPEDRSRPPVIDPSDRTPWYALAAEPRREAKALKGLKDEKIEAYLPVKVEWRRQAHIKREVEAPIFPGYLFIRPEPGREDFKLVEEIEGVQGVIRVDRVPFPIPASIVHLIAERQKLNFVDPGQREVVPFDAGDSARVADGPFAGFLAMIEKVLSETEREVLITIFGRLTRAKIEIERLAAV